MRRRAKADLALVLITLFWGATFTVVKGALDHASVFAFMVARFALAALLMAVIYRKALRRLSRAEILAGAQIGFLMFAGYALQTFGLVQTTPSKAAFITGSSVVMVPVLLALFWKRRIGIGVWAGALAALAGLYYLSVPREGFSGLNPGDPLVLVCALMFALHIILVGRYSGEHSVGGLSFLQVATTAILAIVAVPVAGAAKLESLRFDGSSELVTAVLITAVLATAVAFSVQVWAQQYTTPTHTAIIFSLEPVFAALTSYIVAGERLAGRALLGAVLILLGIVLAELKGPTQAAAESPGPVTETPEG
jgi:drug/metabolite transporter (DMT)-like permease